MFGKAETQHEIATDGECTHGFREAAVNCAKFRMADFLFVGFILGVFVTGHSKHDQRKAVGVHGAEAKARFNRAEGTDQPVIGLFKTDVVGSRGSCRNGQVQSQAKTSDTRIGEVEAIVNQVNLLAMRLVLFHRNGSADAPQVRPGLFGGRSSNGSGSRGCVNPFGGSCRGLFGRSCSRGCRLGDRFCSFSRCRCSGRFGGFCSRSRFCGRGSSLCGRFSRFSGFCGLGNRFSSRGCFCSRFGRGGSGSLDRLRGRSGLCSRGNGLGSRFSGLGRCSRFLGENNSACD